MIPPSARELLERPLHGLLTIPPGPARLPAPRPVWFELTDAGELALFSLSGALKVRRLTADPQATLVVVRPAGEPEGWVSVEADVTIHTDGAGALASRLADRYWGDGAARPAEWAAEENLRRIVLHPRRVTQGPA